MTDWLVNNLANIIVIAILVVIVVLAVRKLIKNKKSGKSSCGCNCSTCPMSNDCHKNQA